MKVDLFLQAFDFFYRIQKKKKMAEKFDQDTLNFLMEDNKINDEKFNELHKKMFHEMLEQSWFLACDLLKKKGERPGVGDFKEKMTNLTIEIMGKK